MGAGAQEGTPRSCARPGARAMTDSNFPLHPILTGAEDAAEEVANGGGATEEAAKGDRAEKEGSMEERKDADAGEGTAVLILATPAACAAPATVVDGGNGGGKGVEGQGDISWTACFGRPLVGGVLPSRMPVCFGPFVLGSVSWLAYFR